jgi:hypothetical protein
MFDGSLPEIGELTSLDDATLTAAAAGWARVEAAAAARKQAVMAELFRRRTGCEDALDRNLWWVDPDTAVAAELAAAQHISQSMALAQTYRAVALRDRLPRVAALFEAGLISEMLARTLVYRTALMLDAGALVAIDAALAEQVTRWGALSLKKTEQAIDALVEAHDPDAVRRGRQGGRSRYVDIGSAVDEPGYASVYARVYADDAVALGERLDELAYSVCPNDPRTRDERRSDALRAMTAGATTLACGCGRPDCTATTSGGRPPRNTVIHVVAHAHTLADAQQKSGGAAGGEAEAASTRPAAEADVDEDEPIAEKPAPSAEAPAAESRSETASSACAAPAVIMGGGVIDADVIAALRHRATVRTITHPGDAPPEPRYRPSTALDEYIRCRDLTCRFPGCDRPAHLADIDHTIPYPDGPTCASNLACLCRMHHLLKTFWTGGKGWRVEQFPDATLIWTAPTGQTHTTRAGSALLFPDLAKPTAPVLQELNTDAKETDRGAMMPRRRRTRNQDRAYRIAHERQHNATHYTRPPPPTW